MSANSTAGTVSDVEVLVLKTAFYQIAAMFILWGELSGFPLRLLIRALSIRRPSNIPRMSCIISSLVCESVNGSTSNTPLSLTFIDIARKRGLRNCLSRQCLSLIVVIMLASTTVAAIIQLEFYIIQFPDLGRETPMDKILYLHSLSLGINCLARVNVRIPLIN